MSIQHPSYIRPSTHTDRVKNTTFSESFLKESDPVHAADKLSIIKRDSGPIQRPEEAADHVYPGGAALFDFAFSGGWMGPESRLMMESLSAAWIGSLSFKKDSEKVVFLTL
ncbi:hypothetical protein L202_04165 [Cryptococcus amylolentus CBS 6039]|uniref:Uncharacterized protein n=1 Tax=Cryptococcus amylolentus CBS 6039 TaxID=1295533 RepID=A0A1E3HQB7_9TREE|nr:hypothetical protein L202_04165 [Cryptococcus amylolentus CBS 6039]ODN78549.1 hypothetical protein L202_04165 [Cryptococcus amylolentus CBS 6039]